MTTIVTIIALVVMAWFAVGNIWNVRKGSAAMRWMQGGLPLLGQRTTVRWLGTTSVELVIQQAKSPFARVILVIFLQARDVPWLWLLGRGRGRRDTVIVRALLRHTPKREFDVVDPKSWSGRDAVRSAGRERWLPREVNGAGAELVVTQGSDKSAVDAALELARQSGLAVRRLSLRGSDPHLQLHVDLPGPTADAEGFFRAIQAIGERATR